MRRYVSIQRQPTQLLPPTLTHTFAPSPPNHLSTHPHTQTQHYEQVRLIQRLLEEQKRRPKHIYTAKLSRMRDWDERNKDKKNFICNKDASELRGTYAIVGPEGEKVKGCVFGLHCLARDPELSPFYVSYAEALMELGVVSGEEEEPVGVAAAAASLDGGAAVGMEEGN